MIINNMKNILLKSLVYVMLCAPVFAFASDVEVRPFLIDRTVEGRDYISEEIVITNNKNHRLNVYATVNEITVDQVGEIKSFVAPIMTDRTNTVTSWAEITRGRIEIEPGETAAVPLSFRIHPSVEPGEYHVFIGFVPASKRYQAEAAAMAGDAEGVIVKLTVEDERSEYLRIAGFVIDRFVTNEEDRRVSIELENLGEVTAAPEGEIIFFNSTGEEINAVPVNTENLRIPPGETVTITSEIPFGNELGRFKANLSLQYGEKQKASLYDTTQFFMMPLHIMLLMLLVAILVSIFIFLLLHKALVVKEEHEDGIDLPFMVKEGHDPQPKDHDIDLSNKD